MENGACLLLLVSAIGYAAYSASVYRSLRPRYLEMRLVAASRPEAAGGDLVDLRRAAGELAEARRGADGGAEGAAFSEVLRGLDLQAAIGDVLTSLQRLDVPKAGAAALLARTAAETRVVEDASERLQWHRLLHGSARGDGDDGGGVAVGDLEGTWRFCFRDYVNEEELGAMAGNRNAFTAVRLRGATRLEVRAPEEGSQQEPSAALRDTFALLGVVPVEIEWRGRVAEGRRPGSLELVWDDTSLRAGWGPLGATVRRPAAAEKLRREPWEVEGLLGGGGGPPAAAGAAAPRVLALCRRGVGRLAFRRL